ncbi:MAG: HDOD domain-containing protein [bacterium]|nr:HDOD domain-containing protein [bacterium]
MTEHVDLTFIDRIEELTAMSTVALDLMAMLNSPSTTLSDITSKVKLDPAITAYILKYCNSPFLGLRSHISSISHGVNLVGFARCKSLLMDYFLRNLYGISGKKYLTDYLWEHSLSVAIAARELAERLKIDCDPEEAYVAGLLHDIGKLVIYYHAPDSYEQLMQEADRERIPFHPLEAERYGYTHAETGLYLMQKWLFSDLLKNSARYHHDFSDLSAYKNADLVRLVAFANSTIHFAVEKQEILPEGLLEYFGILEADYYEVVDEILHILGEFHLFHMTS